MTLNMLKKIIDRLCVAGCGRMPVCVDKSTFNHPCEGDGQVILDVKHAYWEPVLQGDPDGGTKVNKDGSESYKSCVVLYGTTDKAIRKATGAIEGTKGGDK